MHTNKHIHIQAHTRTNTNIQAHIHKHTNTHAHCDGRGATAHEPHTPAPYLQPLAHPNRHGLHTQTLIPLITIGSTSWRLLIAWTGRGDTKNGLGQTTWIKWLVLQTFETLFITQLSLCFMIVRQCYVCVSGSVLSLCIV